MNEQIGLRIDENLNLKLSVMADEIGISKNALIRVLIDLGLKTYNSLNNQTQQG